MGIFRIKAHNPSKIIKNIFSIPFLCIIQASLQLNLPNVTTKTIKTVLSNFDTLMLYKEALITLIKTGTPKYPEYVNVFYVSV